MPYIPQEARLAIANGASPSNVGELTYMLTHTVLAYVQTKGTSFATFADVLAALDATAREFYRRMVAPYEDAKIKENGDVYP